MNKTHAKRMLRLAEHIDTLPPTPAFVEQAYEHFRTTGELPEALRLAEAVVDRVLRDDSEDSEPVSPMAEILARLIRDGKVTLPPGPPPPPREMLFQEATSTDASVRSAARLAFQMLVRDGRDVTAPGLLDGVAVQEGGVGAQVIVRLGGRDAGASP